MLQLIWILNADPLTSNALTVSEIQTQKQLENQIELPLVFDNILDCPIALRSSLKSGEKNILIIRADLASETVPEVHHLCHVVCIFVYQNHSQDFSEQCTSLQREFKKVIIVSQDDLVERIQVFKQRWQRNASDSLAFSVADCDETNLSVTSINGSFVLSQLLIHYLLQMKPLPSDREEFCNQCIKVFQQRYESEKNELWLGSVLEELRRFQEDIYGEEAVLRWYTKDSFLYRMLNKSLRTDDVAILFHSRYVIRELNEQLYKHQYNFSVRVYRGQRMSNVEAELLAKSVGQRVCMKSFLSTSLSLEVAEMYADVGSHHSTTESIAFVIFIIDAKPCENNKRLRPFADITEISDFGSSESEILFMLGSIFCIKKVKQDVNGRWIVSMTSCDEEDDALNKIFAWLEDRQNVDGTNNESFHSLGLLLLGMGMPYETERLYRYMLDEYKLFPPEDVEMARCYHMLGTAELLAGLAENANAWWERPSIGEHTSNEDDYKSQQNKKVLDRLRRVKFKFFHSSLETPPTSISDHSHQFLRFHNALRRLDQAMVYVLKSSSTNVFLVASIHHSFANTYRALRDYKNALKNYEKCLVYYKECVGGEHRLIAEIYTDIGRMYYDKKEIDKALDYYIRGLTIAQRILPEGHPELGVFHTGVAVAYWHKKETDKAKFHFEAIGNMDLTSFPKTNPPLYTYYETLYIFYPHRNNFNRSPKLQMASLKPNSYERTGIIFYRCPSCFEFVWIYKAFFFCKGSPCFRCLRRMFMLQPPKLNARILHYMNYIDKYAHLIPENEMNDLLGRELRHRYILSPTDNHLTK